MRTAEQDRSWNKEDTLGSEAEGAGKPVQTDDEATKPSEQEIVKKKSSDRQDMKICDKVEKLKDESKSKSMQENWQRGNLLSEETNLKIHQMGNAEIHELRKRKATTQCPLCSGHVLEGLRFCKCGAGLQLDQVTIQKIKQKFLLLLLGSYNVPVFNKPRLITTKPRILFEEFDRLT